MEKKVRSFIEWRDEKSYVYEFQQQFVALRTKRSHFDHEGMPLILVENYKYFVRVINSLVSF